MVLSAFKAGASLGAIFCIHCFLTSAALAEGPAVASPNGKIDLSAGAGKDGGIVRIGGSLALPLGDAFGVQADLSLHNYDVLTGTGALHLFTRDPDNYLAGVTAGIVRTDVSTLSAIGVEGELYLDRVSIEGWAGYARLDYVDPAAIDKDGVFALADVGYYATDDLRLSLGASYVLGYKSISVGLEYQFTDTPFSTTLEARVGDDGDYSVMGGLRFAFGGEQKTLIERHRQDDPPDRGFDLFAAAGSQVYRPNVPKAVASDFTDYTSCTEAGFSWQSEHCV